MSTPRVLVIGIDGATPQLIEPWAEAGELPALSRLMQEGAYGRLQAWPSMNSAAAWTSLVTGCNPAKHGIYDFGDIRPWREQRWRPVTGADRKRDPFWRHLSAAGQKVGLVNVPISYPADQATEFALAGLDAPDVSSPGFAHPPSLIDELLQQGIDYPIDLPSPIVPSMEIPHRLARPVQQMIEARARAVRYLMAALQWDVLMVVFVAADRIQHFFWPDADAPLQGDDWMPVRDVYRQLDSFVGDALEVAGAHTTVLVISDHGAGPYHLTTHCLNQLFAELGLLRYHHGAMQWGGRLLERLLLYGRRTVPRRFRTPLSRAFPRLRQRAMSQHLYAGIDWSQTQAFAAPFGQVFVNLRGREPAGIVSAEDYEAVRGHVRDILLSLTDAKGGLRMAEAVHLREDVLEGPYLEQAADLLVEWDEELLGQSLCCRVAGKSREVQVPNRANTGMPWQGSHRSRGVFIAWGPHIKPGSKLQGATLYDAAPTILHLRGQPIPRDMDGVVLVDIFTNEWLGQNPIKWCEPAGESTEASGWDVDTDEERMVEARLRTLGYID
jgi:predicted AlkP superfamily phosphohydrolase/phosphomutase